MTQATVDVKGDAVIPASNPDQSAEIGKLAHAMAKVQGAMKPAARSSENPFFKSKYADLLAVWDAAREQLAANEIAVIQTTNSEAGADVVVTTILAHSSGQWIRGHLRLKPTKADPQGIGSAITYARRYALAAIIGVATEDDDGNAASGTVDKDEKKGGKTKSSAKDAQNNSAAADLPKSDSKAPFWCSELDGRKWIFVESGSTFPESWLKSAGMKPTKKLPTRYCAQFSQDLWQQLQDAYELIKSEQAAQEVANG